jgi:NADPH-dependent 2,4-dienoyl-CoA reductase/sulfur reductase-like enzyme
MVFDEQPAPGGQIWRAVEARAGSRIAEILGDEYGSGISVSEAFRASGALYRPCTQVWQIEPGWRVFLTCGGVADSIKAGSVLVATGAQERPAPFPGWTLPGVMTVGAAQILMKNAQEIPSAAPWIAGSGPLVLLYMAQLLRAGGAIGGWLDTSPPHGWQRAIPHTGAALRRWRDVLKGLKWSHQIQRAGFPIVRGVTELQAHGINQVEEVSFRTTSSDWQRVDVQLLLIHEGVIPSIHVTQALGCEHVWSESQRCFAPKVDEWAETSQPGVFVAGDSAGIAGARAAIQRGSLAAIGVAIKTGKLQKEQAERRAVRIRRELSKELAIRPMLDAMYPPRPEIFSPPDHTLVCRCEELTAGEIRAAESASPDPNHAKSLTRAGMGPCQGRQCGYTIASMLASAHQSHVKEVGLYRVRPPLKPLTLGQLASLDERIDS